MKKIFTMGMLAIGLGASAQIVVQEGFEATTFPPAGWSTYSTASFTRNTTAAQVCEGSASARRNIYGSGNYSTSYLMYSSSLSNGNEIAVNFKYVATKYSSTDVVDGNFLVEYSNDGGTSWNSLGSVTLNGDVACSTFTATIPAGAVPSGSDFKFKITGNNNVNNSNSDWYLGIDSVQLTQVATCYVPLNVTTSILSTSAVELNWNIPMGSPTNGYEIYYSTSNTPPTTSTVPQITGVNGTSTTITGLQPDTTYYFWVRSNCGGSDITSWSTMASGYTGYCIPTNTGSYYVKTISTTGALTNLNYSASSYQSYVNNSSTYLDILPGTTPSITITPSSGTNYYYVWVDWNKDLDFNDPGETLVATTSYASSYTGDIVIPTSIVSGEYRMRVANSWSGAATSCGPSSYGNHVDYTLRVITPTCWSPTTPATISNITHNSAEVTWTAPATAPASYDVYYSTTNTPPTATTVPQFTGVTGTSVTLTGLNPVSSYYVWVRGNCGADTGVWSSAANFATECQPPVILSVTGQTVCWNGIATLTATGDAGTTFNWYADATSTTPIGTGPTFTTPILTQTTDYYVSAISGQTGTVGKEIPVSDTGNTGSNDVGLMFSTTVPIKINTVDVYPTTASTGTITVSLKNSAGTVLASKVVNINTTTPRELQTIQLDFDVPVGTNHRLVWTDKSGVNSLIRESSTSNFSYPYTFNNLVSITSAYTSGASNSYYYYFYNWNITAGCESPRQVVTATVDPNCLGTDEVGAKKDVKVYPNPFTDVINISDIENVKSVTVNDASGKLVKVIEKAQAEINLKDLNSGLYILTLEMKDGSKKSHKVIKK